MRHSEFCKHYRAMSAHATCEKGVAYDEFMGLKFDERPCFERDGVAPPGCPLAVFPTAEEREEKEKWLAQRFANTGKARDAIVARLGGPWKRGTPGGSGVMDCPVCNGKETLHFSRSGYNGHVHAACTTADCVNWME